MSQIRLTIIIALSIWAVDTQAEVINSSANGFVIEIKASVAASPEDSYAQFLRIGEWWDSDHSWFGSADNLTLEPVIGGCFCERSGNKQAQHMQVSFVEPGKELRLLGGLGPLQMMGVHGAMSWKFNALSEGGTEIVHSYAVSGYASGGLDKLAPVVNKVQSGQVRRLAQRLLAPITE